jgi:hypothetical protein
MEVTVPVVAGAASTITFVASTLPMLVKAGRTRDLGSYSFGNIGLANVGNAVHSVYVFSLPPGPVWVLHSFYVVSTVLMLVWYLRYERFGRDSRNGEPTTSNWKPPNSPDRSGRAVAMDSCTSGRWSEARCASAVSHSSTTNTVSGCSSFTPTS